MPVRPNKRNSELWDIVELTRERFLAQPSRFQSYFPELANYFIKNLPEKRAPLTPFGLTSHERQFRLDTLSGLVQKLEPNTITALEAVDALSHVAVLITDDNLPEEVDANCVLALVKLATGVSPRSAKKRQIIDLGVGDPKEAFREVSLTRGIVANLSWDMKVSRLTISPGSIAERKAALLLVGLATKHRKDAD